MCCLVMVVGSEFVNEEEGKRNTSEIHEGGVFPFNNNEKNKINELKIRGWTTILK